MKRTILSMMVAVAAMAASAAIDDVCLTFKSTGIDCYKDGTRALDGEFYALVWVAKDATFGGFNADGTLVDPVNNEVIVTYPYAKGGKLPKCKAQVSQANAVRFGFGGSLHVILLDTRLADGTLAGRIALANGGYAPARINGYESVSAVTAEAAILAYALNIPSPILIEKTSEVPEGAPKPVITSATLRDGAKGREFVIRVKGTAAYLNYTAAGVNGTEVKDPSAASGAADPEAEIEIVIPATDDTGLFKVIRSEG